MSNTPYTLDVDQIGGGLFEATLSYGPDEIASFQDKSIDGAAKKAKAYAAEHKVENTPPSIVKHTFQFHL